VTTSPPSPPSSLPAPAPAVNPETKPFWDATTEGRLLLPRRRASARFNLLETHSRKLPNGGVLDMTGYFHGKAALVTGGGSGIGRAVAGQLADERRTGTPTSRPATETARPWTLSTPRRGPTPSR
jgi:hypothetical protein